MEAEMKERAMEKMNSLREILQGYGRAVVAFSGGVDSAFLLKAAQDVLGGSVLAVTAALHSLPEREREAAEAFCRQEGIRARILAVNELAIPGFARNPRNRCYHCKKAVFEKIKKIASEEGAEAVLEGSNRDDEGDFRPGMQALGELGIRSPLRECGLTKAEIRYLSRAMGLPTWDKPSCACLSSRFVYGETITEEKLAMVEQAERFLLDLGFRQVRVRMHGEMARIETALSEISRFAETRLREDIVDYLRHLGFSCVSLDLEGYRTGSMNRLQHNS